MPEFPSWFSVSCSLKRTYALIKTANLFPGLSRHSETCQDNSSTFRMSLADFPNYPPAVQQQILNGPAMMPPNGTIPNLIDPPNHTNEAIAIAVICLLLGVSFGIMRLYSRLIVSRKLHLEDCTSTLPFICVLVAMAATFPASDRRTHV